MNLKNGILVTSICLINIVACSSSNTINSSWMADNKKALSQKKLTEVVIPGSHYSNAYGINDSNNTTLTICNGETHTPASNAAAIEEMIKTSPGQASNSDFINYLNTQTNNVHAQLNNGIRYLEFNVCIQNANYYTSNYYLTNTLEDTLNQVSSFIDSNDDEIVFIEIDNIYTDYANLTNNDLNIFHNYLQTKFGSYLMPKKDWQKLTFGDIWTTKHRIILISSNPTLTKYYDVWDKNEIINPVPIAEYNTIKKLTLIQQTLTNESSTKNDGKFNLLPIYSGFDPQRDSLNQLKAPSNDHLIIDYLRSLPASTPLNIIITDKKYNRLLVDYSLQKNLGIVKSANESQ